MRFEHKDFSDPFHFCVHMAHPFTNVLTIVISLNLIEVSILIWYWLRRGLGPWCGSRTLRAGTHLAEDEERLNLRLQLGEDVVKVHSLVAARITFTHRSGGYKLGPSKGVLDVQPRSPSPTHNASFAGPTGAGGG